MLNTGQVERALAYRYHCVGDACEQGKVFANTNDASAASGSRKVHVASTRMTGKNNVFADRPHATPARRRDEVDFTE